MGKFFKKRFFQKKKKLDILAAIAEDINIKKYPDTIRICSIDIGVRNCAFYIEELQKNEIQYLIENENIDIPKLYSLGKRIYWDLVDFKDTPKERGTSAGSDTSQKLGKTGEIKHESEVFDNVIKYLHSNLSQFDKCSCICIERQYEDNYNAQVLQHFIFSFFRTLYGPFKYITDISATRKTQELNAPKNMTQTQRKKWAVDQAHHICDIRNDMEGFKILYSKKSDDLADSCIQCKAFCKMLFSRKMIM